MLVRVWQVLLAAVVVSAATSTKSLKKRAPSPQFVTTQDGHFSVEGAPLDFVGTNAYWLPTLNTEEDIDNTLASIAAAGITVVRTWAFNDVEKVPENGTWFQLVTNGQTSVNEGPNGLQKLDTVVRLAEKHKLYLLLTLTNNWNPRPHAENATSRDITPGTGNNLPRNTLSNDFGGMDVYVREFADPLHDTFYTNQRILDIFKNYTTQVVKRYVNSPAVFAWELANDPRCNSTLPSTNSCTPKTITRWHADVAAHVKSVDPNHLVSSGNQGFLCVGCPKLYPPPVAPPPPQTSATPGRRRRSPRPITKRGLLEEWRMSFKKSREARKQDGVAGGTRIRGRWIATPTRRQADQGLGPAYDGSHGVDSQDILGIPDIGFGTFQLFPDQAKYGPDDPNLSSYDNIVQQGNQWIQRQADVGKLFGKPVSLNAFGLVTQSNAPSFVPFNSTQAPFAPDSGTPPTSAPYGVTDQQRDQAYTQWLQTGLQNGLSGMIQYQWSQGGLTPAVGTSIVPASGGTTTTPIVPGTGVSPNDGYGIQGVGQDGAVQTIQQAAQAFAAD